LTFALQSREDSFDDGGRPFVALQTFFYFAPCAQTITQKVESACISPRIAIFLQQLIEGRAIND
jgi:hypothetical protein